MHHDRPAYAVTVIEFPETRLAAFEHRGDPGRLDETLQAFIEWRKRNALTPATSSTFNLVYGDPRQGKPEDYRIDLCVATGRELTGDAAGAVVKRIPAGRCARLRHTGDDSALGAALAFLMREWLPASGETRGDFPLFFQRVSFPPFVAPHEAITDIHLPLRDRPAAQGPSA